MTIFSMAVVQDYQLKKTKGHFFRVRATPEVLEKPWNLILDFKGT